MGRLSGYNKVLALNFVFVYTNVSLTGPAEAELNWFGKYVAVASGILQGEFFQI